MGDAAPGPASAADRAAWLRDLRRVNQRQQDALAPEPTSTTCRSSPTTQRVRRRAVRGRHGVRRAGGLAAGPCALRRGAAPAGLVVPDRRAGPPGAGARRQPGGPALGPAGDRRRGRLGRARRLLPPRPGRAAGPGVAGRGRLRRCGGGGGPPGTRRGTPTTTCWHGRRSRRARGVHQATGVAGRCRPTGPAPAAGAGMAQRPASPVARRTGRTPHPGTVGPSFGPTLGLREWRRARRVLLLPVAGGLVGLGRVLVACCARGHAPCAPRHHPEGTGSVPLVSNLSAPTPHVASRRPTTPRRRPPPASGGVVPGRVGQGAVSGRGWHGM
jgi:hypothetical protein